MSMSEERLPLESVLGGSSECGNGFCTQREPMCLCLFIKPWKTQSTFGNICHPLCLFRMCVFCLQEASGKAAGTFFFESMFPKVEFPADYTEVKHGGS